MKTKIKQALKWIVAAIFLLVVMKLVSGIWGGPPFHGAHGFRPHHGMGHGAFGQPHMMRGQAFMGGFQWIWTIAAVAFWSAVSVILILWFKRKANSRSIHQPLSYPSHSIQIQPVDFLDEWEKNQTKIKEEQ